MSMMETTLLTMQTAIAASVQIIKMIAHPMSAPPRLEISRQSNVHHMHGYVNRGCA